MHIPDGYLSPSTCATLYAVAGGGWYVAFKRVKSLVVSKTIPLISVFAAFSFVIMMFNLPLPGGTTGHAVGIAIATIVLGPWGAILSLSIVLAIQALMFGDGGITTLGANCFNMAIVGSFVVHWTYRWLSGAFSNDSRRQIIAGAVSGYLAVNVAALLTAIEFGIQPTFFHDASGVPLYAPYPLHISIPAMMIGHLTLAGLAEAIVTAGMISYLQKSSPSLLPRMLGKSSREAVVSVASLSRVWLAIAILMTLTPLGILAAGVAWGEWSIEELAAHPIVGQNIPVGLSKLSSLWTAPLPDYAPAFIRHPSFGYFLSALFGVGLLWSLSLLSTALVKRWRESQA